MFRQALPLMLGIRDDLARGTQTSHKLSGDISAYDSDENDKEQHNFHLLEADGRSIEPGTPRGTSTG